MNTYEAGDRVKHADIGMAGTVVEGPLVSGYREPHFTVRFDRDRASCLMPACLLVPFREPCHACDGSGVERFDLGLPELCSLCKGRSAAPRDQQQRGND